MLVNPSSPKGGCNNPQTVFALVLKIAQPRGKIALDTFKFILSLHFQGRILGGGLWGPGPPGVTKGAPKKKKKGKGKGKKERGEK